MQLIDTHAHLTFPELEQDIDQVIQRSGDAGVTRWITVATDPAQLPKVLDLTSRYDNIFAALGYHPHDAKDITDNDLAALKELAANDKVVAIGETGLDYHYNFSKQPAQKQIFRAQLDIARQLDLPAIIHCRNAFDQTLHILDDFTGQLKNVVFHCYGGTPAQTEALLERGCHLSFTGIVTFKKSDDVRAAAKLVPLDRMMIETDCPYISPEPVRNKRPCEPAMLIHTAKKLAEIHEIDIDHFAQTVTRTSEKFFNLPQK